MSVVAHSIGSDPQCERKAIVDSPFVGQIQTGLDADHRGFRIPEILRDHERRGNSACEGIQALERPLSKTKPAPFGVVPKKLRACTEADRVTRSRLEHEVIAELHEALPRAAGL